jgi:threonine dehydrogenase-like Zn-dependent dehydrogenase
LNGDDVDVAGEVARLMGASPAGSATGKRGPDVVVEATGSPAVVALCLDLVGRGGRVVLLGSTRGRIELDVYSDIHRKGVQVIGAHETTQAMDLAPTVRWTKPRNLQLLAGLFAGSQLDDAGLISHTIPAAELPGIYEELAQRPQEYLGVLVDWRDV